MSYAGLSPRRQGARARWLLFTGLLATWLSTGCFNRPPTHGTAILVEANLSSLPNEVERQQALASVRDVLGKRAYKYGVNYTTELSGTNRVWLKVGLADGLRLSDLERSLVAGGVMECRMVHPDSQTLIADQQTPPGYNLVALKISASRGRQHSESLLVNTQTMLKGGIESATVMRGAADQMEIGFRLNPAATRTFAEVTRTNVGHRLAILLDGELQAAPVIRSPIEGGAGVISGTFTPKEAFELAYSLELPLPVPVRIVLTNSF